MPDKTEAPTPRKIAEARKEGMVALSQELNAAIVLFVSIWLLTSPGRRLLAELQSGVIEALTNLPKGDVSSTWYLQKLITDGLRIGNDVLMIVVSLLVVAMVATFAQTRFLISTNKIKFDLNRLNPLNGFKKLFSMQGIFEWIKALLKLILIGWVVYAYLRDQIQHLLGLNQLPFKEAITAWSTIAIKLTTRVASVYLILAIADYAYQRWTYMRSLRMSKEEVKEEVKRSEGDPMIKSRIRGQMRRIARMRMMANVPKADVIITNPTHLAIAIRYDPDHMNAPIVLAKGAYLIAERIVATAREHHIPIIQNIPLAHALYRTVDIDQEIPPELYIAMAEVLAHVYALRGKAVAAPAT